MPKEGTIFALNVLPVIIFLGALIGVLYHLRVIQWFVDIVGSAISWALKTTKIESVWAATVIFLGQSEAPLLVAPYLKRLTRSELSTLMSGGFASVAGSTLVGYALLGAPLNYLLAATVIIGCLLLAFIATIALANGILGGIGGWFGAPDLTFQKVLGWVGAPVAWLIGCPGATQRPPAPSSARRPSSTSSWRSRRSASRCTSCPRRPS